MRSERLKVCRITTSHYVKHYVEDLFTNGHEHARISSRNLIL